MFRYKPQIPSDAQLQKGFMDRASPDIYRYIHVEKLTSAWLLLTKILKYTERERIIPQYADQQIEQLNDRSKKKKKNDR